MSGILREQLYSGNSVLGSMLYTIATVEGDGAAVVSVTASASGHMVITGTSAAAVSVTALAAGAMSITGIGAASLEVTASAIGGPAVHGVAIAVAAITASAIGSTDYVRGTAEASATITASASGTASPIGAGAGSALASISASGTGAFLVSGTAAAAVRVTASAVAAHGVAGTGVASVVVTAAGGDYPVATASASVIVSAAAAGFVGVAAGGIWLYLHTSPPAQIYQSPAIRGRLNPALPAHSVPFSVSETQAQLGARNDSFRVNLDRPSEALRGRLAAQGPYGVRLDVMDGGEVSRSGIVSGVSTQADGSIEIDCEGAGWADDLPLRTNADLGVFATVERLPWRFGRSVPGRCLRMGNTGTLWLWADHASSIIRSVTINGQTVGGWSWRNDIDALGNPITIVQTVDAIDEGASVVATGDGALDPLNGALLTNPADVVYAICVRAGRTVDRGSLVAFRNECLARHLEVSGTVEGGSLQGALASIAESIHAAFGRELPGLMRLRPRSSPVVTIPAKDTPSGSANRAEIATRLRVRYALEDGQAKASMELRAPSVEVLRGVTVAEVTLPWVRDARVAYDVGERMLAERARPRYVIRAARQQRRHVPGDVVSASVASLALSGSALVTAATIAERGSTPTLELYVGSAPAITLAASSTAFVPQPYTGATVVTQGDQRVLTITAPDGSPLAGASCLLNGSNTRTTDSAGRVSWPASLMPPGVHTITISASGYATMTMQVTV